MSSSISFAAGGIDVAQMVTDLEAVERQPLNVLRTRQAAATTQTTGIATIKLGVVF